MIVVELTNVKRYGTPLDIEFLVAIHPHLRADLK